MRMRLWSASMLLSLVIVVFSVQSGHALTVRSAASQGTSGKSLIAAGANHSCVLSGDGTVQCWGDNGFGQLGDGTTAPRLTPVRVIGVTTAVAIALGENHTCALMADGSVQCWGQSSSGQLGNAGIASASTPVTVSNLTRAVAIGAGRNHTCALMADGTARCWGYNGFGQLGNGFFAGTSAVPVAVSSLTTAVAIGAGGNHTCALMADGTVRCWGSNSNGQLGNGTIANSVTTPVAVTTLAPAVAIGAGGLHTCALMADGTGRCWGNNGFGQLGNGLLGVNSTTPVVVSSLTTAVSIGAGTSHTCALLGDGSVQCWGRNASGQLGDGTPTNRSTPGVVIGLPKMIAVAPGGDHTCALTANGTARCWGSNVSGQLGDGTQFASPTPVTPMGVAGSISAKALSLPSRGSHYCALRTDGTAACWGNNAGGQVGDGTTTNRFAPVPVSGLSEVVAITTGTNHTCAVRADGTVRCWGFNSSGQLGDGTSTTRTTPVLVSGVTNVIAVAAGENYTCALQVGGTVRCWGVNGIGQLGDGTFTTPRLTPVAVSGLADAVALTVSTYHSCALRSNGAVVCWGYNVYGQLGDGTTIDRSSLVAVLGVGGPVASIAAGWGHTCALRADSAVRCWGDNQVGELAIDSSTTGSTTPVTAVGLSSPRPHVIAGSYLHTCAVLADGTVRCWGRNDAGQLGDGTLTDQFTPVAVSGLTNVTVVTAGLRDSCALRADGAPFCWGRNSSGELGRSTGSLNAGLGEVPSFRFNIDPAVDLGGHGRVATVTALVNCAEGDQVQVRVSLTQGSTVGHGVGIGACTGGLEGYEVTVPAQGRAFFTTGPAHAEADAIVRSQGAVVDEQEWTRNVQIQVAP